MHPRESREDQGRRSSASSFFPRSRKCGFSLSPESLTYAAAVRIINFRSVGGARDLKVVLPPNRLDTLRPVFWGGCQSVGTDDRSAFSSGSIAMHPTSGTPTFSTPRFSLTESRSNDGTRSRCTSHESSISCYRRYHAESVEDTIVHPHYLARVVHVPSFVNAASNVDSRNRARFYE